jgi:hypothetical protein
VAEHASSAGAQDCLHIGIQRRGWHHRHPVQAVYEMFKRVTCSHQTQLGRVDNQPAWARLGAQRGAMGGGNRIADRSFVAHVSDRRRSSVVRAVARAS